MLPWLEAFTACSALAMMRLLCFGCVDTLPFCLVFHDSQTSRRMQSIHKSCGICGSLHRYVQRTRRYAPESRKLPYAHRQLSLRLRCRGSSAAVTAAVLLLRSLQMLIEKSHKRRETERHESRTSSRPLRVELVNRPHVIVFAHSSQQSDTCTSRCFHTRRCARRANASASTSQPIHDERMLLFLPNHNLHHTRTPVVNLQPAPFVRCSRRYQRR